MFPKFKKGDIVTITAKRHNGCVGRIEKVVNRKDLDKQLGSAYRVFIFDHNYHSTDCSGNSSKIYWFESDLKRYDIKAEVMKDIKSGN